jgi:RNA polymerase subunit RPABC4/transcription elongation factor Spt4
VPTYKHPCPHCATFIFRDVAACPFCGVADPFAPKRCTACRTALEDPSWVACPRCGEPTGVGGGAAAAAAEAAASAAPTGAAAPVGATPPVTAPTRLPAPTQPPAPPAPAAPVAPPARACAGCTAPLPEGARFCTVCGTLAG